MRIDMRNAIFNETLIGGCVRQIMKSDSDQFQAGDYVLGMLGWREFCISFAKGMTKIDPAIAPVQSFLGTVGMPGRTAYFGLDKIAKNTQKIEKTTRDPVVMIENGIISGKIWKFRKPGSFSHIHMFNIEEDKTWQYLQWTMETSIQGVFSSRRNTGPFYGYWFHQHQFEKTFLPAIYESRLLMFNKTSIELEKTPYYKDHTETFGYNQCVSIYTTLEIDSNGDVSLCRNYHDYVISNV